MHTSLCSIAAKYRPTAYSRTFQLQLYIPWAAYCNMLGENQLLMGQRLVTNYESLLQWSLKKKKRGRNFEILNKYMSRLFLTFFTIDPRTTCCPWTAGWEATVALVDLLFFFSISCLVLKYYRSCEDTPSSISVDNSRNLSSAMSRRTLDSGVARFVELTAVYEKI